MGLRRALAALALVGCGTNPAAAPEPEGCELGQRVLLVTHDPIAYDATTEVRVEGARPGETVSLWWSPVEEPGCTCPEPDAPCFELEAPELLGTVVADAAGRGTIEVTLPPDELVGTRWLQATTREALSARTPARVSARMRTRYADVDAHYRLVGDGIGRYVAPVGDIDRDGRVELAATAPARGALHLFDVAHAVRGDGEPPRLDDLPDRVTLTGPFGPGTRVTGVGDFDLDGFHDLVVSAPGSGLVWLVPGGLPPGEHAIDDVAFKRLVGPGLGVDLAGTDTDGDGRTDLVVGSPGRLLVSKGADLEIDLRIDGLADLRFGPAGDLDGDGRGDLVIGSADGLFLFFGPSVLEAVDPTPGLVVGPAGDLNDDGFGDVLLADPLWDEGRGRLLVLYGPVNPPVQALAGEAPDERLGLAVGGAGDLDGDEKDDLLATRADGTAVLLYGPAQGYLGSDDADVVFEPSEGWRYVALPGPEVDVDGDAVPDVVLGSVSDDGATGAVQVFRGAPGW